MINEGNESSYRIWLKIYIFIFNCWVDFQKVFYCEIIWMSFSIKTGKIPLCDALLRVATPLYKRRDMWMINLDSTKGSFKDFKQSDQLRAKHSSANFHQPFANTLTQSCNKQTIKQNFCKQTSFTHKTHQHVHHLQSYSPDYGSAPNTLTLPETDSRREFHSSRAPTKKDLVLSCTRSEGHDRSC